MRLLVSIMAVLASTTSLAGGGGRQGDGTLGHGGVVNVACSTAFDGVYNSVHGDSITVGDPDNRIDVTLQFSGAAPVGVANNQIVLVKDGVARVIAIDPAATRTDSARGFYVRQSAPFESVYLMLQDGFHIQRLGLGLGTGNDWLNTTLVCAY